MPKLLHARAPRDGEEERQIRKLAGARHAPADWIQRAQIVVLSWEEMRGPAIAAMLGCHPETVRRRLRRFNAEGIDGLGDRPGPGRRPRITQAERSRLIALVKTIPPGRLRWEPWGELEADDEDGPAVWTLDALTAAAREQGIDIHRSQVRRILLKEGVRWRRTRSWTTSKDPDFAAKERRSSACTPTRRTARSSSAPTSWGR
ncbi:transposase [Streptosporangium album]|uniref:Transposase n=1 Tax=Streptosporangium album TaxID=47479 RepID=A0A7W7RXJ6_9ACTN|nr:helix-turn-helix domain-containing protein [Streptosporangium album]MBB4936278.1 transposase [Streptosporangium album]MBB4937272.1 transposase [Streptosporangium album]MBB4938186.1 transposase [Streptosporangium album]MBB4939266.1 transposase [Streptosporangium album]MBB4939495.1 transposase [Streptosporangium album]